MATTKLKELQKQYEAVCNEYLQKFCNKERIEFSYWVSDEVGGIAVFYEHYYFDFQDIVYHVNTKQPKGLIFKWQDDYIEGKFKYNYRAYIANQNKG